MVVSAAGMSVVFCLVIALLVVTTLVDAIFRCDCSINGVRNKLVRLSCSRASTIEDVEETVNCEQGRYPALEPSYFVNPSEKKSGYRSLYRLYRTSRKWQEAAESCRRDGAHLAVPGTQEELKFLADQLNDLGEGRTTSALVGVRKAADTEPNYASVTGEEVNSLVSANWLAGTPFSAPGQLCVALRHVEGGSYGFRSRGCEQSSAYFCEKPLNPPLNPNYRYADGLGFYMPLRQFLPYLSAEEECQTARGHLVVPEKQQEADTLMNAFDMYPQIKQIYVGIDDRRQFGVFETVHGVQLAGLSFQNWAPGALETRSDYARCVTFTASGSYQLVNCETPLPTVCELDL